jgi:Zn ribbon nucleic-acid-binding protein
MQFGETFPSLLQLEALSKTFTELLSSVVGLLSACPDVSLRSVSSYRCPTKPTSIKICYSCNKQGHIAKYCKYDILCKHCGECGHIQRDYPAHKEETARKEYGDYFHTPSCCYLHTVGFRIAQNWF